MKKLIFAVSALLFSLNSIAQKDCENAKIYYNKALDAYPAANSPFQKLQEINALSAE